MIKDHTQLLSALRARFRYDPSTGFFTHRRDASRYFRQGERAERPHSGRPHLRHGDLKIPAMRVAWAFVHGEFPPGHVAPVNGDVNDLRACNLALERELGALR